MIDPPVLMSKPYSYFSTNSPPTSGGVHSRENRPREDAQVLGHLGGKFLGPSDLERGPEDLL